MIFPRCAVETRRVAERAEALGFSWLGIADSPTVYQESYLHQLEALHATRRLIVGPVATHVTLRHPLIVGNLLATLNEIGDGRTVGVLATGNSGARGVGLTPATARRLGEAVTAIRGYWAGVGGHFDESRIPATAFRERDARYSSPPMGSVSPHLRAIRAMACCMAAPWSRPSSRAALLPGASVPIRNSGSGRRFRSLLP
jgi:alkanesulfonate monooxygenase SsuD/methylene tetrahydromethanopterin reductase-like flavin-dependent oxidoreductase (luciferase family)